MTTTDYYMAMAERHGARKVVELLLGIIKELRDKAIAEVREIHGGSGSEERSEA